MTQPVSKYLGRFSSRLPRGNQQKQLEDKQFRDSQDRYDSQGYAPEESEKRARNDFDLAQAFLKRRRRLPNVPLDKF